MASDKITSESQSVPWEDPKESRNPKNWTMPSKLFHISVPCVNSFLLTFATSVMVPTVDTLAMRFDISRTASLLPLTLYTIGLGFGPPFTASLSEVFGRKWLYVSTLTCFVCFTAGAGAAQSFTALLVCRFFAGFLGSAGVAMGAGTISDVFVLGDKAGNMAALFFILGPFLGPTLGPLAGAYVFEDTDHDWRWTLWLLLIIAGPILVCTILMKETAKVAIVRETDRSSKIPTLILGAAIRPAKMMLTDVVIFSLSVYTAYAYAMIFSFFASAAYVLGTLYSFDRREVGLGLISVIIGYLLAIVMFGIIEKRVIQKARDASPDGKAPPEYQLIAALIGSLFIPIALFWYAWEAHRGGRWASLVASGIPLGFGSFSLFVSEQFSPCLAILADSCTTALAANGILRYTLGAVFPLFTIQMYENLGVHWASSVFAILSLALLPIPWVLFRYGPALRARQRKEKSNVAAV
ncbi:putative MFS polyamine transporter [Lophiotrema nucula]|uniref:Putative MFS polyamine transporter n=1 Tax=Lophiotrema nucula TaxID=690887 RepID=A0A6A5ZVM9_9PLEO|nr:putative MFS polyamine transporter [Lophiotrema nucula]